MENHAGGAGYVEEGSRDALPGERFLAAAKGKKGCGKDKGKDAGKGKGKGKGKGWWHHSQPMQPGVE
eukprot:4836041-Amphidinium_carterae.1